MLSLRSEGLARLRETIQVSGTIESSSKIELMPPISSDPFHSYLAIAALAMLDAEESGSSGDIAVEGSLSAACDLGLKPLDAAWNVDVETKAWLVREMQRVMAKRDMDISKMTS